MGTQLSTLVNQQAPHITNFEAPQTCAAVHDDIDVHVSRLHQLTHVRTTLTHRLSPFSPLQTQFLSTPGACLFRSSPRVYPPAESLRSFHARDTAPASLPGVGLHGASGGVEVALR
ncbi:hypothetical protein R3P38DRAFT_3199333 [Favolaschia claudopus]|uniref:Uncharacterized protein n=1 Tax=Favolaschia claudopus TaxID=2862362 RepID=A0AAW0B2N5_9AGAR